jgi:hypothetical protein
MTSDSIAGKLSAWQDRLARVSRNLGEINDHPALLRIKARLRDRPDRYRGETAARIDNTLAALGELWNDYLLLNALLDQADGLRKQSGLFHTYDSEIDDLLDGRSITLPATHMPLAERGLLTTAEHSDKATADELLAAMEKIFTIAKDTVLAFDRVETRLAPRIAAIADEARVLTGRANAIGETGSAEIAGVAGRVEALASDLAADPLGAGTKVDEASAMLANWRARLDAAEQERAAVGAALVAARAAWQELRDVSRRSQAAYEESCAEIVDPAGLLRPTDAPIIAQFGAWLDRLDDALRNGGWRAAKVGLDKWMVSRNTRLAAERRICAANQAPLAARDELRGRLKGLRAKANVHAVRGLRFDPEVVRVADEANSALNAQPADLRKAAGLIAAYEAAINLAIRGG